MRDRFSRWIRHLEDLGSPTSRSPSAASCMFCNVADNRYFDLAEKRGLHFDELTPDDLVAQRRPYVEATRQRYREFWTANVGAAAAELGEAQRAVLSWC
jgi:hypothetical protein